MTLLLKAAGFCVPPFYKKMKLRELFLATAAAFGCEAPSLSGLTFDESLLHYALFTQERAGQALERDHDLQDIQSKLFESAFQMGQKLRSAFRLCSLEQAMVMGRILYRALKIDFRGISSGEIEISRCYFSQFYSPQICELISSLDEGILAGLAGDGRLTFSQRITEGRDCCKALFVSAEQRA